MEEGKSYDFSLWVRCAQDVRVRIEAAVKTREGECICAEGSFEAAGGEWKKYELTVKAAQTTWEGRLFLTFPDGGCCEIDMVSLFPRDTFRGRKNGMRTDIAQALCEMKPKFVRFPGGCLTHTGSLDENARDSMYRWKRTLGPVEERPARRNNWGYNQTFGIGYYEYFPFLRGYRGKAASRASGRI